MTDPTKLGNTRSTKGATTKPPGTTRESISGMRKERITKISNSIKDGTYTPSPVSEILIPKPRKLKKRSLGIPAYKDKLVSEACRMVLNAIYEPAPNEVGHNGKNNTISFFKGPHFLGCCQ